MKILHLLYSVLGVYVVSTSEFEEVHCCLYSNSIQFILMVFCACSGLPINKGNGAIARKLVTYLSL